jgi:hypothetical protein
MRRLLLVSALLLILIAIKDQGLKKELQAEGLWHITLTG